MGTPSLRVYPFIRDQAILMILLGFLFQSTSNKLIHKSLFRPAQKRFSGRLG